MISALTIKGFLIDKLYHIKGTELGVITNVLDCYEHFDISRSFGEERPLQPEHDDYLPSEVLAGAITDPLHLVCICEHVK
jgi:hypothetical protein